MAERQMGVIIEEIRVDHAMRYRFAAERVSGRVLDIACGCGYGARILAAEADQVVGVDRSAEAIEHARSYYPGVNIEYRVRELGEFKAPDGFDWAVCFETIEHVREDAEALRVLRDAAPDLIISVPNEDGIPYSKKRFPFHVRHYTAGDLEALLADAGWRLSERWSQIGPHCHVTKGWGKADRTLIAVAHRA